MSLEEQFSKKQGNISRNPREEFEGRDPKIAEFLAQGKGLEAFRYASQENLIHSDEDIHKCMEVVTKAMGVVVKAQDDL